MHAVKKSQKVLYKSLICLFSLRIPICRRKPREIRIKKMKKTYSKKFPNHSLNVQHNTGNFELDSKLELESFSLRSVNTSGGACGRVPTECASTVPPANISCILVFIVFHWFRPRPVFWVNEEYDATVCSPFSKRFRMNAPWVLESWEMLRCYALLVLLDALKLFCGLFWVTTILVVCWHFVAGAPNKYILTPYHCESRQKCSISERHLKVTDGESIVGPVCCYTYLRHNARASGFGHDDFIHRKFTVDLMS